MQLALYFDILKRYALIILIVSAATLAVVATAGILRTPIYQARATIRIMLDPGLSDFVRRSDDNDRLLRTYEQILSSNLILEKVLSNLEPDTQTMLMGDLRDALEVKIVPETELISVTVSDENPVLARDLANEFVAALIEYNKTHYLENQTNAAQLLEQELSKIETDLENDRIHLDQLIITGAPTPEVEALKSRIKNLEISLQLRWEQYETARLANDLQVNSISLAQPATTPTKPSNALSLQDLALTLILGLAGGLGLALTLENIDSRFRSSQQLERLSHLPVLGIVSPELLSVDSDGQIGLDTKERALSENYRLISLNLQRLIEPGQKNKILITSAGPGEGKSTVTANLGRVFAEQGKTVFVIEGDMRRPSLNEKFGMDNGYLGLSSLLAELSSLDQVIYPTEQRTLFVIGGNPVPTNPTALLTLPAMDRLLNYLGSQGQLTLLDAPPVLGVADVSILAPKVDGVVLVVHQDITAQENLNQALKQLQAVQAKMVGLIFIQKNKQKTNYTG
jgi:non-specific protein-tyrosine kinase